VVFFSFPVITNSIQEPSHALCFIPRVMLASLCGAIGTVKVLNILACNGYNFVIGTMGTEVSTFLKLKMRNSYLTTVQIRSKWSPGYSIFLWSSTSTSFAKLNSKVNSHSSSKDCDITYRSTPIASAIFANWPCSQQTSTFPGPV
jgi:hypothetical protein